jgi:hypothetical protein
MYLGIKVGVEGTRCNTRDQTITNGMRLQIGIGDIILAI